MIVLSTCKEIQIRKHHMMIFEREFRLQGQHACCYRRGSCLVFSGKKRKAGTRGQVHIKKSMCVCETLRYALSGNKV